MKRLLPALILGGLLSQGLSAQVAQVENTRAKPADWEEINFEFGQAVIVDGFPSLLRLADLLKSHPDYKVNIVGNTDQIGSNRANDALSLRRADAVAQFLQKYGANPNQIMTKGDGKRNLEENATNRNARFINRRVVITVTAPDGTVIGDGSIGSAIEDFITYARGQLSKIDGILAQLQTLEAQVRALNTSEIKADTRDPPGYSGNPAGYRRNPPGYRHSGSAARAVNFGPDHNDRQNGGTGGGGLCSDSVRDSQSKVCAGWFRYRPNVCPRQDW